MEHKKRTFDAIISNDIKDFANKDEMIQNQKDLKAYIKGKPFFIHGITEEGFPKLNPTSEKWLTTVNNG